MKTVLTIARREASSFFQSPMAYIVIALFLLINAIFFFPTFFIFDRAELRGFFQLLPLFFSFFLPAVTMRMLSEEFKSGTIETLITLPAGAEKIIAGKYLAALGILGGLLAPTLLYLLLIAPAGDIDPGPVFGGYLGAFFLGAAYTAVGLFASSRTGNQIVAFVTALSVCLVLTFMDSFMVFLPPFLVGVLEYFSAGYHFETIARGILDSRAFVYFISLSLVFLIGAVRGVEARR
jgi:ABC-2 type transport system permease protein